MSSPSYPRSSTALLFVDPYNDFLAEGGKLWPIAAGVAQEVGLLDNLRRVVGAVRAAQLPVFVVPHHRFGPEDFSGWQRVTPYQLGAARAQPFAHGSWGGEWHPDFAPRPEDVVVAQHWGSSGFANTDLDYRLKQRGISDVILIGLLANTCVEGTARFAAELGYRVTLVTDATAAASAQHMHAAHVLNGPTFAQHVLSTAELVAALAVEAAA